MLTPYHMTRMLLPALLFASISCDATPQVDSTSALRVYAADFRQRMNSVWLRLVSAHANDMVPGTAKVSFHILPDGRVTSLRLTSNTGNAALAKVALETVRKTRLGRLPSSLLPTLPHGYLPVDNISFQTYIQDESDRK
jgi:TonB family protein